MYSECYYWMKIEISTSFIRYYLGNITAWWIIKYGIAPDAGYFDEFQEFMSVELNSARRRGDLEILQILAKYLIQNPQIDLCIYNESEADWSQEEMTMILDCIISSIPSIELFEAIKGRIELVEMPLKEWREKIKPAILQMIAEGGLDP